MVLKYSSVAFSFILAALFSFSALTKLLDIQLFAQSLNSYKLLPVGLVPFFSYYIPLLELGLVVGFIVPKYNKAVNLLTIFVVIAFQISLASLIVRDIDVDCACFGRFASTPKLALFRNFGILLMTSLLLFASLKNAKLQNCNQA